MHILLPTPTSVRLGKALETRHKTNLGRQRSQQRIACRHVFLIQVSFLPILVSHNTRHDGAGHHCSSSYAGWCCQRQHVRRVLAAEAARRNVQQRVCCMG